MSNLPVVGVIMGSDSDLPVMQGAIDVLVDFGVPHEVRIISAHRTPDVMLEYARGAASRGLCVIIAGAGGAAHLPGMTASMTSLPVIGVPVPLQQLDGLDALLSIAQMPVLANSGLLQAAFYVVAGIGWVLPAMPIVSWMSRPDAPIA